MSRDVPGGVFDRTGGRPNISPAPDFKKEVTCPNVQTEAYVRKWRPARTANICNCQSGGEKRVLSMLAAGVAVFTDAILGANAAEKITSMVHDFKGHGDVSIKNPQNRGTSDLVRTLGGVSMNIDTTDLPVGAYTVWWVIFNNPGGCSDGACGANDTGRPKDPPGNVAEGGVLWATGGIVGPDRMGHFSASLGKD